jgi:hypothetical protein
MLNYTRSKSQMSYITPEAVQKRLISLGDRTPETVPSFDAIQLMIDDIEYRIDTWLGYSPLPKEYHTTIIPNHIGYLNINSQAPPTKVLEVKRIHPVFGGTTLTNAYWTWDGKRTIEIIYVMGISSSGLNYEVRYIAGLKEIPPIFENVAFALLRHSVKNNCDTFSLEEPTRDLTSVNLPGGMSQQFKLGENKNASLGTWFERFVQPLGRYKHRIKV